VNQFIFLVVDNKLFLEGVSVLVVQVNKKFQKLISIKKEKRKYEIMEGKRRERVLP